MKDRFILIMLLLGLGLLIFAGAWSWFPRTAVPEETPEPTAAVTDRLDAAGAFGEQVERQVAVELAELEPIPLPPRWYPLAEETIAGPRPDPQAFGSSENGADTLPVMEAALPLMEGQSFLWDPETTLFPGSSVRWYRDDSIVSITWKEVIGRSAFSFTEVKVAHPSQFRRYLADDAFDNPKRYTTHEMAQTVNAVSAMSGDFYQFRRAGAVVYRRTLYRDDGYYLDTCYVDGNGDLNLIRAKALGDRQEIQDYIDTHDILFSLSFGPVLIENYQDVCPAFYMVGEITDRYSRACICQLGPCHYLLVTVNHDSGYSGTATLRSLTDALMERGVQSAYVLDGGQTATMVVDGQVFNHVDYGSERLISDIIYFATAVPEAEETNNGGTDHAQQLETLP